MDFFAAQFTQDNYSDNLIKRAGGHCPQPSICALFPSCLYFTDRRFFIMKKIFFACVAIISMLLFTAQPLMVHAITKLTEDDSYVYEYDYETSPNPNNWFSSLQADLNAENLSYEPLYYLRIRHGNNNESRTTTIFFTEGEFDFTDNVLTLSNLKLGSNNYARLRHCFRASYMSSSSNSSNNIDDIYIDFNNKTCKYTISGGSLSDQYHVSDRDWYKINTNCPDGIPNNNTIDVIFTPSLSGVVTRPSTNDNGVAGLSNYFSMDITNNTNYGCQYRMMIKDTNGQAVTTYNQGESDTNYQPNWENGFSVNDDGSFVFINDEWIYVSPTIGGGVCKALKPSEWHYIDSHDSIHQDFAWSQFDFKKDHTYICMVYAITNDLGCATALDASRTGLYNNYPDYCLDFTTQALVYQTVFSISNPATFNPNDNSFGNKIRNANWSGDKGDFSAYEDPSNGNTISGNGNVDELRDLPNSVVSGGSHGGGGYSTYHDATLNNIYGSGSYTSNRSFAQLNSYFGGYFGFLSAIIGFYPSPYQTLIMIGFAGLVVIGILKAAIK